MSHYKYSDLLSQGEKVHVCELQRTQEGRLTQIRGRGNLDIRLVRRERDREKEEKMVYFQMRANIAF